MKSLVYRCPHCLPETIVQMNREEFLEQNTTADSLLLCDACGSEVETELYLMPEQRIYCKLCATKYILPHCNATLEPLAKMGN